MIRALAILALALPLAGGGDGGGGGQPLTFNGQISMDVAACVGCHGAGLQEGGYRVDTYAEIVGAGADAIPNVDPANVLASELIIEVDPNQAPRAEHAAFANATRVQLYTDWITAGAPEM